MPGLGSRTAHSCTLGDRGISQFGTDRQSCPPIHFGHENFLVGLRRKSLVVGPALGFLVGFEVPLVVGAVGAIVVGVIAVVAAVVVVDRSCSHCRHTGQQAFFVAAAVVAVVG